MIVQLGWYGNVLIRGSDLRQYPRGVSDVAGPERVRLFVAVWPPPEVAPALQDLPRPGGGPPIRWTAPPLWHVTLAFLGDRDRADVPQISAALEAAAADIDPPTLRVGPASEVLSHRVLVVPIAGLDHLAAAVRTGLGPWLGSEAGPPFRGHLTLARARGRGRIPPTVAGAAMDHTWIAREFTLTRSVLGTAGPTYYSEATFELGSAVKNS